MKKFIGKLKTLKPSKRKLIQLYLALLFNANLKGFISGSIYGGKSKIMCAPGINCYSCPGAIGACPLGSMQGSYSNNHTTIFYVFGIIFLYAILFGRMICGWACPFGLIGELLYKIKSPKLKKSPVTRVLSYLKYVVLVLFVGIGPIMYALRGSPMPGFCKYICPVGTIEGGLGLLSNAVNESYLSMLGPLFTWKFILMISIVVGSIFIFRLFCRFICPLGGLYGLFNKFSMFGVKVEESKCTHCNLCISHCKVDIKHVGDQECISCGECIDVCPTKAIHWKGPKIFLKSNEIPEGLDEEALQAHQAKQAKKQLATRIISTVVMLAVLIGVIGYYWNSNTPIDLPDVGNQVGALCYGYDMQLVDENGIATETLNPADTGKKITIINFWGTWCPGCVAELPYFDQIATEYKDNVAVVAVHSYADKETAPAYIAEHYLNSEIRFVVDYDDKNFTQKPGYYDTLGGRGEWPRTVVLDENGVITHIIVKALHYEDLQEIVESML